MNINQKDCCEIPKHSFGQPQDTQPCLEEKMVLNTDLGPFGVEAFESRTLSFSPQVRAVQASGTLEVPIINLERGQMLRVNQVHWQHFSRQADQDIRVLLKYRTTSHIQTGKIQVTDKTSSQFVTEFRPIQRSGYQKDTIALTAPGTGIHDNYFTGARQFIVATEETKIVFQIINQSDLHQHILKLHISGWVTAIRGKNKGEILKEIVGNCTEGKCTT